MTTTTTTPTRQTAETRFVEADGVRFAFRRFGSPAELPIVMLQHFRGNLDNWDAAGVQGAKPVTTRARAAGGAANVHRNQLQGEALDEQYPAEQ